MDCIYVPCWKQGKSNGRKFTRGDHGVSHQELVVLELRLEDEEESDVQSRGTGGVQGRKRRMLSLEC